jgi:hypothetical protein
MGIILGSLVVICGLLFGFYGIPMLNAEINFPINSVVEPAAVEPVEPAAVEPVEPAAVEPVEPAAVEPVEPAAVTPEQTTEQPEECGGTCYN